MHKTNWTRMTAVAVVGVALLATGCLSLENKVLRDDLAMERVLRGHFESTYWNAVNQTGELKHCKGLYAAALRALVRTRTCGDRKIEFEK